MPGAIIAEPQTPRLLRQAVAAGSTLLLMTDEAQAVRVLPALRLLPMSVRVVPPSVESVTAAEPNAVVLLDARHDHAQARQLCRRLGLGGNNIAVLVILDEEGVGAVGHDWGPSDIVLSTAGPAEVDARLRLLRSRRPRPARVFAVGPVTIDVDLDTATLLGELLHLTRREFDLLTLMAQEPDRLFAREELLDRVWGDDFAGGIRTVDVHVRRLRAKLEPDHGTLIGTVRKIGYRVRSVNR